MCVCVCVKVDPYDYEKIEYLLSHSEKESAPKSLKIEQGLLLLDCLKHYKRVSAPSEAEGAWFRDVFSKICPNSDQVSVSEVPKA